MVSQVNSVPNYGSTLSNGSTVSNGSISRKIGLSMDDAISKTGMLFDVNLNDASEEEIHFFFI